MLDIYSLYEKTIRFAGIREDFVDTGKITKDELNMIRGFISKENQKYLSWVIRQWLKDKSIDLQDLNNKLTKYNMIVSKGASVEKDINKIQDIQQLKPILKETEDYKSKKETKEQEKIKGAELVYDQNNIQVYYIKTKEASCLYGKGTKWCISGRDEYFFYDYAKSGSVYIIVDNNLPPKTELHKICLIVGPKGGLKNITNALNIAISKDLIIEKGIPLDIFKYRGTLQKNRKFGRK